MKERYVPLPLPSPLPPGPPGESIGLVEFADNCSSFCFLQRQN